MGAGDVKPPPHCQLAYLSTVPTLHSGDSPKVRPNNPPTWRVPKRLRGAQMLLEEDLSGTIAVSSAWRAVLVEPFRARRGGRRFPQGPAPKDFFPPPRRPPARHLGGSARITRIMVS